MFSGLSQSPAVRSLQRQLEAMPARDRAALKVLAVVVAILVLYFALWQPAQDYMNDSKSLLDERVGLLKLVRENRSTLAAMSKSSNGNSSVSQLDSQQLVSTVTSMAQQQGVALKRFEPSGEREIKVWVDDVAFDKLVSWLSQLKARIGVTVEQISLEKEDKPGLVSARLTLAS